MGEKDLGGGWGRRAVVGVRGREQPLASTLTVSQVPDNMARLSGYI